MNSIIVFTFHSCTALLLIGFEEVEFCSGELSLSWAGCVEKLLSSGAQSSSAWQASSSSFAWLPGSGGGVSSPEVWIASVAQSSSAWQTTSSSLAWLSGSGGGVFSPAVWVASGGLPLGGGL